MLRLWREGTWYVVMLSNQRADDERIAIICVRNGPPFPSHMQNVELEPSSCKRKVRNSIVLQVYLSVRFRDVRLPRATPRGDSNEYEIFL